LLLLERLRLQASQHFSSQQPASFNAQLTLTHLFKKKLEMIFSESRYNEKYYIGIFFLTSTAMQ